MGRRKVARSKVVWCMARDMRSAWVLMLHGSCCSHTVTVTELRQRRMDQITSVTCRAEQDHSMWWSVSTRNVPSRMPQNHTVFLMDRMRMFPRGPSSLSSTVALDRSPDPFGDLHPLLLLLLLLLLVSSILSLFLSVSLISYSSKLSSKCSDPPLHGGSH